MNFSSPPLTLNYETSIFCHLDRSRQRRESGEICGLLEFCLGKDPSTHSADAQGGEHGRTTSSG